MKKSMRKKQIKKIIIILTFLLAILALFYLFKDNLKTYLIPIYKVDNRVKNVEKAKKKYKNENVTGWIKVQGTNIDYPIIENDTSIYKERTFNYAWVNSNITKLTNYLPIFSHNIRNVSSSPIIGDKKMNQFEQLMAYIYLSFNKDNKYIQYTVNGKNYLYQIFSVSIVSENYIDYFGTSHTKKEMNEYIKQSLKDSYFKYDVNVDSNDKILSLITCTRFNGNLTSDFKIDAKLLENKTKGYNYAVKENSNYKDIQKILEGDGDNV